MIAIKKDFVHEYTESVCGKGKKLSSGKAYFLKNSDGNIVYGGEKCAKELSNTNLRRIPDFTKSLISNQESTKKGSGNKGSNQSQYDTNKSRAITYVFLREEKLAKFRYFNMSLSYSTLQKYYQSYQERNDLSDDEIRHILNIEKIASDKTQKRMSLQNLSTCYAYEYILERTLVYLEKNNNEDGIKFINSLIKALYKYCRLTENQICGLSRWLQFLPRDLREAKLKNFS